MTEAVPPASATVPSVTPPSLTVTVPLGVPPGPVVVAVKVTGCPPSADAARNGPEIETHRLITGQRTARRRTAHVHAIVDVGCRKVRIPGVPGVFPCVQLTGVKRADLEQVATSRRVTFSWCRQRVVASPFFSGGAALPGSRVLASFAEGTELAPLAAPVRLKPPVVGLCCVGPLLGRVAFRSATPS
jgi:hypothetical protein